MFHLGDVQPRRLDDTGLMRDEREKVTRLPQDRVGVIQLLCEKALYLAAFALRQFLYAHEAIDVVPVTAVRRYAS